MNNTQTDPPALRPSEVFMHLIVTYLTPMFLAAAGGDPAFARMAAIETVNAHAARNHADLLPIAQIIAYGLTILDSLNLSMTEDLSIPVILRLRSNAATLGRAAEQCRRALRAPIRETTAPELDTWIDTAQEEAVLADLARAEQRLAEASTGVPTPRQPAPAAAPPSAAIPTGQPTATPLPIRNEWAAGMTRIAREFTAELANLPSTQRRDASFRAAALSSVANDLLSGQAIPTPFPFKPPGAVPGRPSHP